MLGIAMAMAGDLGGKSAPRGIAFVTSGLTLGIIVSPAIGALSSELSSWRLAFAGLGGLALIVAVSTLYLLVRSTSPNQPEATGEKGALFVPGAWGSLLAMTFGLGGAIGCFALVGERLRTLYQWETAAIGAVYVAFGILTLVGNLTMPRAFALVGSGRALMRVAMIFILAAIIVTYVFDTLEPGFMLAALAIWAILGGIGAPGLQTHIAQLAPPRRGTLMALAGSGMNLGVAGATALAAAVYPLDAHWVAASGAALILVAIMALRPACIEQSEAAVQSQ